LFLDEDRAALTVQPGSQGICDGEHDALMCAEHRGYGVDTAGGLPVEAGAVMVAAVTDGTAVTTWFFLLVAQSSQVGTYPQ